MLLYTLRASLLSQVSIINNFVLLYFTLVCLGRHPVDSCQATDKQVLEGPDLPAVSHEVICRCRVCTSPC